MTDAEHHGSLADALSASLYATLRSIAAGHLRRERVGHTLQPTALLHEAVIRLMQQQRWSGCDRAETIAMASRLMRQILIDHARHRRRLKRGGGAAAVPLVDGHAICESRDVSLLDLGDALERLATLSPRQADVVTLRFIGGMTSEETAQQLGVSLRTIEGDWQFARAWLRRELASARP